MSVDDRFATVTDVAVALDIPSRTVRRWCIVGAIPGVRVGDKAMWKIPVKLLTGELEWIAVALNKVAMARWK
jgi:hypothetical protein